MHDYVSVSIMKPEVRAHIRKKRGEDENCLRTVCLSMFCSPSHILMSNNPFVILLSWLRPDSHGELSGTGLNEDRIKGSVSPSVFKHAGPVKMNDPNHFQTFFFIYQREKPIPLWFSLVFLILKAALGAIKEKKILELLYQVWWTSGHWGGVRGGWGESLL